MVLNLVQAGIHMLLLTDCLLAHACFYGLVLSEAIPLSTNK